MTAKEEAQREIQKKLVQVTQLLKESEELARANSITIVPDGSRPELIDTHLYLPLQEIREWEASDDSWQSSEC